MNYILLYLTLNLQGRYSAGGGASRRERSERRNRESKLFDEAVSGV